MTPLQQLPLKTIAGAETTLGAFAGNVVLVVNVASKCGLTKHGLYEALTRAMPESIGDKKALRESLLRHGLTPNADPEVLWNFEKFLLGRNGDVVARFAPSLTPDDPVIVRALESALREEMRP